MINIGNSEFLIPIQSLSKYNFEIYSSHLFDVWDEYIQKSLKVPDYSISLEVEEGSIKGTGKIAVTVGALYFGIGAYGDFISGLQTIRGQVSYLNQKLVESAVVPLRESNVKPTYRNNSGALTQLQRVFNKVQKGELTVDQAMIEAEHILGNEANSHPIFMRKLNEALEQAPKHPKQTPLFTLEENELNDGNNERNKRLPSRAPSKPDIINQFRVEIWRDSKRDKKHVKVSKLEKKSKKSQIKLNHNN